MPNIFLLIDSNALVHRGFHAIPHLTTSDGTPINAAYGFTTTLLSAIKAINPKYIAATYDLPIPTFRHEAFEQYKAHRVKAPDELYSQIPITQEILQSLSIPIFSQPGYEADDVIGTLSKIISSKKIHVMILTGDMDTLQLVNNYVSVYTLRRGLKDTITYDSQAVFNRFGLNPDQMIDYKALRGDPSDNIPGIAGIGEKTAINLISKYQSLENLYQFLSQNPDTKDIPAKLKEKLITGRDSANLSKKLATIITNIELPDFDIQKCLISDYDHEKAIATFQKYEFKSLIPRLPQTQIASSNPTIFSAPTEPILPLSGTTHNLDQKIDQLRQAKKYTTIDTLEKLNNILPVLQSGFTFDTETNTLDLFDKNAQLVGISLAVTPNEAYYLPLHHQTKSDNLSLEKCLDTLKTIFADPDIPKIAHNLKFDLQALSLENIVVNGTLSDTMIASYLIDPNNPSHHGLSYLANIHLGHNMIPITDLIGEKNNQISFDQVPIPHATIYSAEDADITNILSAKLSEIIKNENLTSVYQNIDNPLVKVLLTMETNGILLDIDYLHQFNQNITEQIQKLTATIHEQSGQQFNISSTKQLSNILFNILALSKDKIKKNKTGISTASDELEKLRDLHPVIENIIQYRLLTKLKNTYVDTLPKLVKSDRKLHTSFNQTITATGRLSSTNPNLQNIPTKSEIGQKIRRAFLASPNHLLLSVDYSQIELRLMAHFAQEENMIQAFNNNEDIHTATAAKIYHCLLDQVTPAMRYQAKTINFSIIYGAGPRNIASQLKISPNSAKDFINQYFKIFPGIKNYMNEAITFAQKNNYSQTLFGRKRPIPEINSKLSHIRSQAERIAINSPLQGTAADLIKIAMIKIQEKIIANQLPIKMLLQVHDELIFEIPQNYSLDLLNIIRSEMENVHQLSVPLKVDLEIGQNWGEQQKISL